MMRERGGKGQVVVLEEQEEVVVEEAAIDEEDEVWGSEGAARPTEPWLESVERKQRA